MSVSRSTSLINILLASCAVIMTAITVVSYAGEAPRDYFDPTSMSPTEVEDFEMFGTAGHSIGPDSASVSLVVFSDFECPYCRQFANETIPHLRETFGDSLRILFRHMPLPNHRFAYPAARAGECAAEQGRFWQLHDVMFERQDSLGLLSFQQLAVRAGVEDAATFEACLTRPGTILAVELDLEASRALEAQGTPTVLVGRWLLQGVSNHAALDSLVRSELLATR